MICELTSVFDVPKIVDLSRMVIRAPIEVLRKRVMNAITHPDSKVYLDRTDENDIRGFIFGSIEEMNGDTCVFIQLCIVKPVPQNPTKEDIVHERQISLELLNKIREWARERGIKIIYFMTPRNPKAFERKFKFKLKSYLMFQEVD